MRGFLLILFSLSIRAATVEFSELETKLENQSKEYISLQQKIESGQKRLGELDIQQDSVRARIQSMKNQFQKLAEESERTENQIKSIRSEIKSLETKSTHLEQNLIQHKKSFYARLNHVYKNKNLPFLRILLAASSAQDLVNRVSFYRKIVEADSGNFNKLKIANSQLQSNLKEINLKRRELERLNQQLIDNKNSTLNRIQTDRDYLEKIATEQQQLVIRANKMDKSSKFLQRQIDNLKYAHQQMSEEVKASRVSTKSIKKIARNSLSWPIREPFRITRKFGKQVEGSATIFLPGIDISTTQESNVLASEDGVVIYKGLPAGENSPTYGKVVMIAHEDHEGKFVTLYGNLTNIQVALDQYVRRGEKIARISDNANGKVGFGGTPRLYYQVIVNLEPQNPIKWLEKQQGT